MRKWQVLYFLIVALGFQHCLQRQQAVKKASDDLSWLIGEWEGSNLGWIHRDTWIRMNDSTLKATIRIRRKEEIEFLEDEVLFERRSGVYRIIASSRPDTGGIKATEYIVKFPNPGMFLACGLGADSNKYVSVKMITPDSIHVVLGRNSDESRINKEYFLERKK